MSVSYIPEHVKCRLWGPADASLAFGENNDANERSILSRIYESG